MPACPGSLANPMRTFLPSCSAILSNNRSMSPGLAQRYARAWRVAHITTPASVLCFCFGPDRAHQFHWRHKVVLIGGWRSKWRMSAVSQPDVVCACLSARDPGDAVRHRPGLGSIKKHARDPVARREQFLLSTDVARGRIRRTRALPIEISTGRSRQLVLARSKPGLGYTPLMKIARG